MMADDTPLIGQSGNKAPTPRALAVWLDGSPTKVGTLTAELGTGFGVNFAYVANYLSTHGATPISASLPLRASVFSDKEARPFFDNLLPEGERRRAEAVRLRIDAADVIGLLEALGRECPGAISVLPLGSPPVKIPGHLDTDYERLTEIKLEKLVSDTAAGRPTSKPGRFSLAGVQQKLTLARDPASGDFLLPRDGAPTTWLLKVETREYRGVVANEALCLSILRRLQLPTVHAERMKIGNTPVLLVARYDREIKNGLVTRRHQEDAAQALGIPRELKYESEAEEAGIATNQRGYAALLGPFAGLTRSPGDTRVTLVRAAHANWLLGNCDAHLKNFAIVYGMASVGALRSGGALGLGCDLAPLYDVVCIGAYPKVDQTLAMRIGRAEKWDAVEREDWLLLAQQMFPGRRVGRMIIGRQLEWLHSAAEAVLPAIDAAVTDGLVTSQEAKRVRDVAGSRIRHLNRTLKWDIPADTDLAPARGVGGWAS